jgi:hypothetical protein
MTLPVPIFVGGCMRSGTTILQKLLCSAPGAGEMIGESYYIDEQLRLFERSAESHELRLSEVFPELSDFEAFSRGIIERYIAEAA